MLLTIWDVVNIFSQRFDLADFNEVLLCYKSEFYFIEMKKNILAIDAKFNEISLENHIRFFPIN